MKLENVVPWGRSLAEYQAMFALSEEDLQKRILGCGDGPASFNAEMASSGRQTVTSVDPLYAFSVPDIACRINETEQLIMADVRTNAASFKWSWFENPDALLGARKKAVSIFLQDYESGKQQKRYVAGALPRLEFATDSFDLCVCSHLLFLYSNQLTFEFHLRSIIELLRLAGEVRIFPLRDLNHERSQHLAAVCDHLQANGFENELVPVNYELIPEANQILRVCQGGVSVLQANWLRNLPFKTWLELTFSFATNVTTPWGSIQPADYVEMISNAANAYGRATE